MRIDGGQIAGCERRHPPVVDIDQSGVVAGNFVPVERGGGVRDDRPRVRVRSRFTGEVTGVEFRDGGVEVVEVECDGRRDPFVRVDFDDAAGFRRRTYRVPIAARVT